MKKKITLRHEHNTSSTTKKTYFKNKNELTLPKAANGVSNLASNEVFCRPKSHFHIVGTSLAPGYESLGFHRFEMVVELRVELEELVVDCSLDYSHRNHVVVEVHNDAVVAVDSLVEMMVLIARPNHTVADQELPVEKLGE